LAAGGCVIELERLEFLGSGRGNRDVGIAPTVGRRQRIVEHRFALPVDRPVPPHLDDGFAQISWVEQERALPSQAVPAIPAEFQPQPSAFERMNAFVCAYELEP